MPDITMCEGYNCPLKHKCYRFLASPSFRQSYFAEDPRGKSSKEHPKMCKYFDEVKGRSITQPLTEGISL